MQFNRLKFAAVLCALGAAAVVPGTAAHAEVVIGLNTTNQIFSFDSATPGSTSGLLSVSGINGSLLDIDFRPANSLLYGLTQSGNTFSLYTINTTTGVATLVTALSGVTAGPGASYDMDFNPQANALRIVGSNADNFRVAPAQIPPTVGATGATLTDTSLNTGVGTPAPLVTGILGAAYTNNFAGTTSTTLYDIGVSGGGAQLYLQGSVNGTPNSPNGGILTAVGTGLGIGTPTELGFDISGTTGVAFVSTSNNGFFNVNLATGTASSLGTFSGSLGTVRGIAVVGTAAPEPGTLALLGTGLVGMAGMIRRRSKKA